MNKSIAIFDAGLGSYAIVEAIKKAYPLQDIIYFADRKSFPYGTKTTEELRDVIENSIDFLLEKGATFIVLASNAPSITVLDKIKNRENVIIDNCENKFGKLDSITLSSTHLPWLSSYFKKIIPQAKLYDPADSLVKAIKPYITTGEGKIHSIISESEKYPAKEFLKILDILNIKLDYEII